MDFKLTQNESFTEPDNVDYERQLILAEIEGLKELLYDTDYIPIKEMEGYDCDTLYPGWKAQRKGYRDRINELEAQLSNM